MAVWNKVIMVATFILQFQELHAQDTLSVVKQSKSKCGSRRKLQCAPSGCCSGTINWNKGGTPIMSAGISDPAGKYTQTVVGNSHFEFTIENLASTDFGSAYECVFLGTPSNGVTMNATGYYCPPCWNDGGKCFGFSLIGVIMAVVIGAVIYKITDKLREEFVKITVITGVTGLVLDVIVSLLAGAYSCLCEVGLCPVGIVIGFVVGLLVVLVVFLIFYFVLKKGNQREEVNSMDTNNKKNTSNLNSHDF